MSNANDIDEVAARLEALLGGPLDSVLVNSGAERHAGTSESDVDGTEAADDASDNGHDVEEIPRRPPGHEIDTSNAKGVTVLDILKVMIPNLGAEMDGPTNAQTPGEEKVSMAVFSNPSDRPFSKNRQKVAALHMAAVSNKPFHHAALKQMIQYARDVNCRDDDDWTPLHYAAQAGSLEAMHLLIQSGAEIDAKAVDGRTPLTQAALRGKADAVKLLLSKGADVKLTTETGKTALMAAVMGRDIESTIALIAAGSDVNHVADWDVTALHCAAVRGLDAVTQVLLDAGADPRFKDWELSTPLHRCCSTSFEDESEAVLQARCNLAAALIKAGAGVDTKDREQRTALQYAGHNSSTELVELLLANDADIDSQDSDGDTVLMNAVSSGPIDTVRLLISRGAHVGALNKKSMNALFMACLRGDAEIVALLLECGIEINYKCNTAAPEAPLMVAVRKEKAEIVSMLLEAGADPCL